MYLCWKKFPVPMKCRPSDQLWDCLIAPCALMVHHFRHSEKKKRGFVSSALYFLKPADRHSHSDAGEWQKARKEKEDARWKHSRLSWHCVGHSGGRRSCWGVKHGWGCSRSPLLMSAPTHSPDVSIHLERHSHTPPRDGASSVGPRLNYSSSSIPVHPSDPPHPPLLQTPSPTSISLAFVGRDRQQTKACRHSLAPTRKPAAPVGGKKSEEDTHTRYAA